jgi:hypothetical protein
LKKKNRLSALMSSGAYDTALQHVLEHNVTGFRAEEQSQSRSLLLVVEINEVGSVRMHPGCKSQSFFALCCVSILIARVQGKARKRKQPFQLSILS